MKSASSNIILFNDKDQVLLHLRDDKPTILYPNTWSLPGGYIEDGETPEECIVREMEEELGIDLKSISLFIAAQRSYGFESTFWARVSFDIEDITLTEGQAVRWFSFNEVKDMRLGYEDNDILEAFAREKPYAIFR